MNRLKAWLGDPAIAGATGIGALLLATLVFFIGDGILKESAKPAGNIEQETTSTRTPATPEARDETNPDGIPVEASVGVYNVTQNDP
jgi:hypothetical protein